MQGVGWRIGHIGSIDVHVDPSFAIIALLFTSNLWVVYADPTRFPGIGAGSAVALAVLAAVLFFASILGHELAHAGMSRLRGIEVLGIVLYMFGGATYARMDDRGPGDEFLTTVVGPIASAVIGGAFLLLHGSGALPGPIDVTFDYLGRLNLALAVFNVLPAFPLDGGRLVRSGLWKLTGSLGTATTISARIGQGFGLALIALAIVEAGLRQNYDWLWSGLIGFMIFQAAAGAIRDGRRRRVLETTQVRELMSPPPPAVPGDMTVGEALERFLIGHEREAFPVMEHGSLIGFVSLTTAGDATPERPVREAMVRPDAAVVAGPDDPMSSVMQRLSESGGTVVVVIDGGRLVGVVEDTDYDRLLRRR
ncbi:MAG TPA: CBS domain-containing protein [Actinomycetota bacterium]|jgi:Zn-dependent protease